MSFDAIRVTRETAETELTVVLKPRTEPMTPLPIPNRLLSHFIDHLCQGSGVNVELVDSEWPGSWRFDHVLCEDLGQLVGRGIAAIHDQRARSDGITGRSNVVCCMDDAEVEVAVSFEGRPAAHWEIPARIDIDGFVDAWYDEGSRIEGWATGTNLRQFLDGFSYGSGAAISVTARRTGNLHHFYETVFRALGDAVGRALGTANERLPGDTSGLARRCEYRVQSEER